ncbi:MAG: glycosyltransferase family 2 protein [Dermatophilaceae bacterium]
MTTLSVLTAVYGQDSASHLPDAYRSLLSQTLPEGWDWEWIIREDDTVGAARPFVPTDDPRVHYSTGRHGGPGVARTMALAVSTGTLVKCLDADDELTNGALSRDIDALTEQTIGWTACRALDLLPDGTTHAYTLGDPPPGRINRGEVLQTWLAKDQQTLMVLPGTLCIRRQLAVALGGWMALPASEDTGLLIAVNAIADGYFIETPGLMYRKWPGQVTAQPAHVDQTERTARNALIAERGQAMEALR